MRIMSRFRFILFFGFFSGLLFPGNAQTSLDQFDRSGELPENLLSTKTCVLVNAGVNEWEAFSEKIHETCVKAGIDAVNYYRWEDATSGIEIMANLTSHFQSRGILNVMVLHFDPAGLDKFKLDVIPFQKFESLYTVEKPVWSATSSEIDLVLLRLYQASARGIERSNFLIPEVPDLMEDAPLVAGKPLKEYNMNLNLEKLAVPRFDSLQPGYQQMNADLELLMKDYPFEYVFVDPGFSEVSLVKDKAIDFVLYMITTNAGSVRRILDFKVEPHETSFISIQKIDNQEQLMSVPYDRTVTKFYIKHLVTGNVYLGSQWDADVGWRAALRNHIGHLNAEVKN